MKEYLIREITKTKETVDAVLQDNTLLSDTIKVTEVVLRAIRNGGKIMFAGNGGSAADSQHLAAELVSKLCYDRPGLPAIALTTDTSALTAIGNDYGYDKSFSRQLDAIGNEGDVFIGISTSGNSANVLLALEAARKKGITTIGFAGGSAGKMPPLCDHILVAPSDETPKIQECHIMLGHIVCALVEEEIFGEEYNPKRKTA
jgi:D-sedoheptulose 7-phosphate isomerase